MFDTLQTGIIPAYAGSTSCKPPPGGRGQDHPRIRGEHRPARCLTRCRPGSSPHTRGARHASPRQAVGGRIIPAYAGSTASRGGSAREAADHPRIRGEHFVKYGIVPSHTGSSPHTRGALRRHDRRPGRPGIIPAYAGSTSKAGPPGFSRRDHPRIRGEHPPSALRSSTKLGSSPHTRGAQTDDPVWNLSARIIPAYAGSTFPSCTPTPGWSDHPRIRGEHDCRI